MKEKQHQQAEITDNTILRKVNNEQIQNPKWKKLQAKYLQYIRLLKQKLEHAEKKYVETKKSSIEDNSHESEYKFIIHRFCGIVNHLRMKCLHLGFSGIQYFFSEQYNKKKIQNCLKISNKYSSKLNKQIFFQRFKQIKQQKTQKNIKIRLLLAILNYTQKNHSNVKQAFTNIKNYHCFKSKQTKFAQITKNINLKFKYTMRNAFNKVKIYGVHHSKMKENAIQQIKYLKNLLSFENIVSFESSTKYNNSLAFIQIYKQNCRLKESIRQLQESNIILKDSLKNSIDQRQREIKKKSQGLELLAEELRQKDELIQQYQRELDVFKSLKDQSMSTLAEIYIEKRKLQLSNSKLNQEFTIKQDIYREQRLKYTQEIKRLEQVEVNQKQIIQKLENELQSLRKYKLESNYQKEVNQIQKDTIRQLQIHLNLKQKKLVKLNHQTNKLMQKLASLSKIIKQNDANHINLIEIQSQIQNIPQIVQQQNSVFDIIDVVQRILINDDTLKLQQLIKQSEQLTRLKNIQQKVLQLTSINQSKQKQNRTKRNRFNIQQSEVVEIPRSRTINGTSVYQAFSGRGEVQESRQTSQRIPNFTIRLIELETQINKKEAVIFGLKQKFMHLRDVIYKLLKSLELRQNLSRETDSILTILFDMFQYSEVEKTQIFKKKNDDNGKKKAGFFNFFN